MNNSKKTMFYNQYQLFKDKDFSMQSIKKQPNQPKIQEDRRSPPEDIFRSMGSDSKSQETGQITWKYFYQSRLKQLKVEVPELTHNQFTQRISDEWKQQKQSKKRKIVTKQVAKQQQNYTEDGEQNQIDFNYKESAEFIERLRENTLKFVVNDQTISVDGELIIQAIANNQTTIYLNGLSSSTTETPQSQKFLKKLQLIQEIDSDSENSVFLSRESSVIENKLKSLL